MSQTPNFCFLSSLLQGFLEDLIGGIQAMVELPPEGVYPTLLRLDIPFLGSLNVVARFENGEILFDEVDLEPIHLLEFVGFLPPGFEWLGNAMQCVIDGKASGWTNGLDASGFGMTIQVYDLAVSLEVGGSHCLLSGMPADPSCTLGVTVSGSQAAP